MPNYKMSQGTLSSKTKHSKQCSLLAILLAVMLSFSTACTGGIDAPAEEMTASGEQENTSDDTNTIESTTDEEQTETSSSETTETSTTTEESSTSEEMTAVEETTDPSEENEITNEETETSEVDTPTEDNTSSEEQTTEPTQVALDQLEQQPIEEEEGQVVELIESAPLPVLERPRRRMNLDQLDLALKEVSGGLTWTERRNNTDQNLFETLSATLGKPDFIQRTTEDLTPSALFMKFLDDAARQICGKRIDLDLAALDDPRAEEASAEIKLWGNLSHELTSVEDAQAIDQQIRALVLRFHSHVLPEGESPRLAYWRWLFETASLVDRSSLSGWRALCIGLITHPDFYSY